MSTPARIDLDRHLRTLATLDSTRSSGRIVELAGLVVVSRGPMAGIGDFCEIETSSGRRIRTQVIGFRNGHVLSMPLEETEGLHLGDPIVARKSAARVGVGPDLLGRILDGFGRPIDNGPEPRPAAYYELDKAPPGPLEREHIREPLLTGIRAIDGMLPCGRGQRIGLFGGSGVGKSTLLGSMVRNNSADVNVIGLIGERNREVRSFLEESLGPEGLKRSVVVTATSDRPAPLRVRACSVTMAVAEYFRDQGANVLVVMDSVTRLAMAQREIGLAAGEPPSQKGYTPSVFSLLPRLFERAGNFHRGSITAFFTVLVEGDDFNEPICDAARSILDGHIVLSRRLAAQGHYPAIDVLESVSRLAGAVASRKQVEAITRVRAALSAYHEAEDLIQLGAYVAGSNPALDSSIRARTRIQSFLRQPVEESSGIGTTLGALDQVAATLA